MARTLQDGEIRWLDYDPSIGPLDLHGYSGELFESDVAIDEFLPNLYLVKSPNEKIIQINVLTLSTKYHLKTGLKYLPDYQIINPIMFDKVYGGNYGNFEFLFFLRYYALEYIREGITKEDKRTKIICTQATALRMTRIWQETYSGPILARLIENGLEEGFAQELAAELEHFAEKDSQGRIADIKEFVAFYFFDSAGKVKLEDDLSLEITDKKFGSYNFFYQEKKYCTLIESSKYKQAILDVEFNAKVVRPHLFATTVVGGGSGFTPDMQTASFVQWVKRKGTLIDLPEFPFMHLHRSGVEINDIVRVLLTHNHADHVAGLFWLLPEYVKGTIDWPIYSTRPIFESTLRLFSAVTQASIHQLKKVLPFFEVKPGIKYDLPEGGHLEVEYSLHSIPAIKSKFTVNIFDEQTKEFQKLTITHSGDTLYDPDYTQKLVDEGVMKPERKKSLDTFVFADGLIFHEVGGPPLHTVNPMLRKHLTDEQLGRLYAYHNSVDKLDINLNVAEEGATLGLINTPELTDIEMMLILLDRSTFFKKLPMEQKIELAQCSKKKLVKKGDHIIAEGETAENIYFIARGVFDIYRKNLSQNVVARMSKFDSFGEAGIKQLTRTASVFAQTDGVLFTIHGEQLKEIVPDSYLNELIEKQLEHRPFFGTHNLFRALPPKTKQLIANESQKHTYALGETILNLGVTTDGFSVIVEGEAGVFVPNPDSGEMKQVANLKRADFFGEMSLIHKNKTMAQVVAQTECVVYFIPGETFHHLMKTNYQFSYLVTNIMQKREVSNQSILEVSETNL